jgi:hypothetical protein
MERIDYHEFALWMAFYQIEPWGEERADLRAMLIASEIANIAPSVRRMFSKGGGEPRPYSPKDFRAFFDFGTRSEDERSRDGRATLTAYFRAAEAEAKAKAKAEAAKGARPDGSNNLKNVGHPRA